MLRALANSQKALTTLSPAPAIPRGALSKSKKKQK
jgi:hypothetical protein